MKEYFNSVIAPETDELAMMLGVPMVQRIQSGVVTNMTECEHCELQGDPRDMFWGENQQPYCSIMCADMDGQEAYQEINQ
jgi:hypothetical protein